MTILELRFHWNAGERMSVFYNNVELHCRLEPYRLQARTWVDSDAQFPLGRLCLLPENQRFHAQAMVSEQVRTICCRFDKQWLSDFIDPDFDWSTVDAATLLGFHHPHIERSMRRLASELVQPSTFTNELADSLCRTIAIDLSRAFSREVLVQDALDPDKVQKVKDFIALSDGPIPSITHLAELVAISPGHLRKLFRTSTGQTLREFLEDAKVSRGCALLSQTVLPLKTIAFLAGFTHQSSFSYAFHRRTGKTPKAYRAEFRLPNG